MRSLVWFRSDLRAADNPALHQAQADSDEVLALYVLTSRQWQDHDWAEIKIAFLLRGLQALSDALADLNIALLIRSADRFDAVPNVLAELCREQECSAVYCNHEYEVNERRRDAECEEILGQQSIAWHASHDQVFAAPGSIRTGEGRFYSVFTPFRKTLTSHLEDSGVRPELRVKQQSKMIGKPDAIPRSVGGIDINRCDADLWPSGEQHAQQRLTRFVKQHATEYQRMRDLPAEDATSRLSAYLALGVLSPHQCLRAAVKANDGRLHGGSEGIDIWISELMWREFYRHILVGFPRVSMSQPFRPETRAIKWNDNAEHLRAWCDGQTGFPIVDAGMRQLLQEGWMHNRLRMITAMFLSKDLLLDWRCGERHFMRQLIDGDLASNNGGWQWSASTGTDAAPYFRIFNPTSQSRKVDPDGSFIRRYVPELGDLSGRAIHCPSSEQRRAAGYPEPIVDHKAARERAISVFRDLK